MTSLKVFVCICVALATSSIFAQQNPLPLPSQFEHLKGLEPLMGVWEGEYQPPGAPKGTLRGTCIWENNRSYAVINWTFAAAESPISVHPFSVRIGFNGKAKAPHFWVTTWDGQAEGPAVIGSVRVYNWKRVHDKE